MENDAVKELADIESAIKEKERELEASQSSYEDTPEWRQIQERKKAISREQDGIMERRVVVEDGIRGEFLDGASGWGHVYYCRGDQYSSALSTNIKGNVLSAIRKHFKIALLRGSDVEEIVRQLINNERQNNKELEMFNEQIGILEREQSDLYGRERELQRGDSKIGHELYLLREKRDILKFSVEHPKVKELHIKRDAERDRVSDPKVIQMVLETIRKG